MENIFDLTGKVAVVTGASSGLGVQFAKILAKYGADLTIIARRLERLQELSKEIESMGRKCLAVKCDVTIEKEIENAVNETVKTYGKIDILVNNAGVGTVGPTETLSEADWDKVVDTNLKGIFLFSKQAARHMIEKKYGKIINTASIYGVVGNSFFPTVAYHASKGGVVNLTRALAAEWAKHNITVNAIGPGFFPSEMTQSVINDANFNKYLEAYCPMKRWGKDGELNGILIYFASDASSYTTGQTVCVDGGWTAI